MWKYIGIKECNEFLLSLNLFNCKDDKKYIKLLYSISNSKEKNYTMYKIKKKNGKYRTIYAPNPCLKHIQKQILMNILNNKAISKYATAYHKGISIKENAIPHINKEVILKLDIKDFFGNITFLDISNLVMKDFDNELGDWCNLNDISYTRYSDDMTFSGSFEPNIVITKVRKMLYKLGLELNNNKICIIHNSSCQNVTGLVVNEKIQVSVNYRRKLRQEIYYINKFGLKSHLKKLNIKNERKYLNSLYGKVLYVLSINNNDKEFIEYKKYLREKIIV